MLTGGRYRDTAVALADLVALSLRMIAVMVVMAFPQRSGDLPSAMIESGSCVCPSRRRPGLVDENSTPTGLFSEQSGRTHAVATQLLLDPAGDSTAHMNINHAREPIRVVAGALLRQRFDCAMDRLAVNIAKLLLTYDDCLVVLDDDVAVNED